MTGPNRVLWDGSQAALDRFEALGAQFMYARTYFVRGLQPVVDRGDYVSLTVVGKDDEMFNVPLGGWVALTVDGYWEPMPDAP